MQRGKKIKITHMGPGGKIHREQGKHPDALETSLAQALVDLSNGSSDPDLQDLVFVGAKEFQGTGENKVIVVQIPLRVIHHYRKVHTKLVRELEKKFSGKVIVFVARRKILPKEKKGRQALARKRPISKTLTAVHEKILEDILHPVEIVGKRIRFRQDGSRVAIVLLDPREQHNVEHKLDALKLAYKKLTGKDAIFQFPVTA
ncbi:40S ribosomal protein S7-1 [Galdieria sulphuraria]|uniref:40S ribosomal protein S7 n=1 Tax=Galdieria sulphuraria TaxID=130081 RepID=M2XL52_GALSU|nr:40S ribosomal protein S7e [Galdieria sulphuraria]EME30867.1 40S ribosomal protein S7e [Galdieria sulphuraria]GJD08193.1 40S ribosomal protein S7-1 [Galdieria sulphuraria]|eukprot:XP_005707387.1 40S ribosomal protein S7e [Galdieria sulphuraria]